MKKWRSKIIPSASRREQVFSPSEDTAARNGNPSKQEIEMPTYEYKCRACEEKFSVIMSLSQYETEKVTCPKCQSGNVEQIISLFIAKTSRKS